ncbi:MAG: hypothetical protein ACREJE_08100, partial [Candidatus Rokuibacteriota bacterium]
MELSPDAKRAFKVQSYAAAARIEGVEIVELSRHRDDGGGEAHPVRVRSMVGLIPLFAAAPLPAWVFTELPHFADRLNYLLRRQPAFGQFLT